jgi:DNA-directed RNA polymerase III subunit RPC1
MNMIVKQNKKTEISVNIELEEKIYTGSGKQMCPKDGYVIFNHSELMCGNLGKATLGSGSKKGLFYALIKNTSCEVAARTMLRLSKFASRWISNYGMSIGINDVTPYQIVEQKAEIVEEGYRK